MAPSVDLALTKSCPCLAARRRACAVTRHFDALSAGGTVSMPLERVEWAELFGSCIDRFGVHWMIDYTGTVQFDPT